MKAKTIRKVLVKKIDEWINSINDEKVRKLCKENTIVTGGCIVSMLQNEKINDYDVYFRNKETALEVARYYVTAMKTKNPDCPEINVEDKNDRISVFVRSSGIAESPDESGINDVTEPGHDQVTPEENRKYEPRFITSNAITLTDRIQIILRFFGEVEDLHTNFDFVHCMCSWDAYKNSLELPAKSLEAIINKELVYNGSKYPLCSLIRTRKFIKRGWQINAGQYLKMGYQLALLDLTNINILEEQTTGVDSAYFTSVLHTLKEKGMEKIESAYLMALIDKIF